MPKWIILSINRYPDNVTKYLHENEFLCKKKIFVLRLEKMYGISVKWTSTR